MRSVAPARVRVRPAAVDDLTVAADVLAREEALLGHTFRELKELA